MRPLRSRSALSAASSPLITATARATRVTRGRVGLAFALVLATGLAACEDEDAAAACAPGTERCACVAGATCAAGLSCFSGLCVNTVVPMVGGAPPPVPGSMGEGNAPAGLAMGPSRADAAPALQMPAQPRDASVLDLTAVVTDARSREGGAVDGAADTAQGDEIADWTVFVYGHGDHNLSTTLLRDLIEMARARLNDKVQVVALVDWNATAKTMGESFPSGAFWYRILGNGQAPKQIAQNPELDFDNPSVLASAISSAFKAFPAKRYGLVLWDHGGAWRGGFGGDSQDGQRRSAGMAVASVASAVKVGLDAAGLGGDRPLDFLAFDTCLMAGVEVVAPFEALSKVYIGNAELDFGDGLDYTESLSWLAENSRADVAAFARAEAHAWDVHHEKAGGLDLLLRSHVAIDTVKFAAFGQAMKAMAAALGAPGGVGAGARGLYHSFPSYFASVERADLPLRDVGNFLENLSTADDPAVAAAAATALAHAKASRIAVAAGQLRQGQLGLHVFGGAVAQLDPATITLYGQLANVWELQAGWGTALAKMKAAAPATLETLTTTITASALPTPENPVFLDVDSPGRDTAYVEGLLVKFDGPGPTTSTATSMGTIAQGFIKAGSARIRWGGQSIVMRVTPNNVPVSVNPWTFTAQGQVFTAPYLSVAGVLRADGDEWEAGLLMDADTLSASHLVIMLGAGQMTVWSITEAVSLLGDKAAFFPARVVLDLDKGGFKTAPADVGVYLPAAGRLSFVRQAVPPGQYVMAAYVEDHWGNSQIAGQPFSVGAVGAAP